MGTTTMSERDERAAEPGERNDRQNISSAERWISMIGGSMLALYGVRRRDVPGAAVAVLGAALVQRGVTGHCAVYGALGIDTAEEEGGFLEQKHGPAAVLDASKAVKVERTVTIDHPAADLYRFWRNLENLPRFMRHLESVERVTDTISHWRAQGPAGTVVEWDAEIHNEVPNQVIGWRSLEGADVVSAGSVNFDSAAAGRGTRVTVHLQYSPPGGKVGAAFAKLFGRDAETEIREDLRRFKQIVEAGEVPTTQGQPRG